MIRGTASVQVECNLEDDNSDPEMNAVTIMLDEGAGVALSPGDARKLAQILIDAASMVEKHVERVA